jgi:hypothetical protein
LPPVRNSTARGSRRVVAACLQRRRAASTPHPRSDPRPPAQAVRQGGLRCPETSGQMSRGLVRRMSRDITTERTTVSRVRGRGVRTIT